MPDPASQIASLLRELHENSRSAAALSAVHAFPQILQRPREQAWSAAECIEHLNLTNRAYLPRIEQAIRTLDERKLIASTPFRLDFNARLLKFYLEPPSRLRLPTREPFKPVDIQDPAATFANFQSLNQQLEDKLIFARTLALDAVKISSPFAEKMKYSLYSAFVLIAAHNRRHLWQAERALKPS